MNKSYITLPSYIFNIGLLIFLASSFTGCSKSKFYYTKAKAQENIHIKKQIPVKLNVQQSGSSYNGIGLQTLTDDIKDIVFDNKLFTEELSSNKTLNINVKNIGESSIPAVSGAVLTGLTLGLTPNVIDRVIIINIQLDGVESTYKGEIIHTQGTGSVDEEYTEDYSINLVKNLVKNALDEFTVKYYRYQN